jgi:hypothetical protein
MCNPFVYVVVCTGALGQHGAVCGTTARGVPEIGGVSWDVSVGANVANDRRGDDPTDAPVPPSSRGSIIIRNWRNRRTACKDVVHVIAPEEEIWIGHRSFIIIVVATIVASNVIIRITVVDADS